VAAVQLSGAPHPTPARAPVGDAARGGVVWGSDGGGAADWFKATREHGGAVSHFHLGDDAIADLTERGRRRRRPDSLPRSTANQAYLDGWVSLLGPHFDADSSCNLTGTYSDDYGRDHGLMNERNVRADFIAALKHERPGTFLPWCVGVEKHNTGRDVLHFHAMVGGDWSQDDMDALKRYWDSTRGWSVCKPVAASGGCVAYCAKHLLKRGAADNFDFQLVKVYPRSRHERRMMLGAR